MILKKIEIQTKVVNFSELNKCRKRKYNETETGQVSSDIEIIDLLS